MTNAEKLTNISILVESDKEQIEVLQILERERPNLKWAFTGEVPSNGKIKYCEYPIILVTDFKEEKDCLRWSENIEKYDACKIEELIKGNVNSLKDSSVYCNCGGPSVITGFTSSYSVCTVCKLEKRL